jgi:hypothetical protein
MRPHGPRCVCIVEGLRSSENACRHRCRRGRQADRHQQAVGAPSRRYHSKYTASYPWRWPHGASNRNDRCNGGHRRSCGRKPKASASLSRSSDRCWRLDLPTNLCETVPFKRFSRDSFGSHFVSTASQWTHGWRRRFVVCIGVAYGNSSMPANAALRCQRSEAAWSSWAAGDGIAG